MVDLSNMTVRVKLRLVPMVSKNKDNLLFMCHIYAVLILTFYPCSIPYLSLSLEFSHVTLLDFKEAVHPSRANGHKDRETCGSRTDSPLLSMGSPVGSENGI